MPSKTPLVVWLSVVCAMVAAMVVIGGITRLTRSGLSIVEWQPVTGILPPLTEQAWQETFEKYQGSPEFQQVNRWMGLRDFKKIFFWEYIHRLFGRLIGFIFFIPYLFFLMRGRLESGLRKKLFVALLLGGLEGVVGWLMVKSGLVDQPRVSHYRLTVHLGIALLVFGYLFWILLDLLSPPRGGTGSPGPRRFSLGVTAAVCLQILYGGLTAGLRAGYGYNTFPKMGEGWWPAGMLALEPWGLNFFENHATVQFLHRLFGWGVLALAVGFWIWSRAANLHRRKADLLLGATAAQFLLGVFTLILVIPVGVATLHQAFAILLLAVALLVNHRLRKPA